MLADIQNFVLDLILPRTCRVCGAFDMWLCTDCQGRILFAEKQICPVCIKASLNGMTHPRCATRHTLDGLLAAGKFSQLQEIIHDYKYNLIQELGLPLSQILINFISVSGLSDFFSDFIVVPVPLHARRLRYRGFNQAKILARSFASAFSQEMRPGLMERIINTPPQTKLDRAGRQYNIKNAFKGKSERVIGKKILLIDDITTTGATLNECAKVLKKAGAESVWALVLAHAAR